MATPLVSDGLYEVVVQGLLEGQSVINVLHYREGPVNNPGEADTLEVALTSFRDQWRTYILPLVADNYTVYQYSITSILDNRILNLSNDPNAPHWAIQYGAQALLPGVAATDKGANINATLPTFVAIGCRKVAVSRARWARGSLRIAGVPEGDTESAEPDRLTAAAETSWTYAASNLLAFTVNEDVLMQLVVFGKVSWLRDTASGVPRNNYTSLVNQLLPSKFISSQVSRKRRIAMA